MRRINPNYPRKYEVKQTKINQERLLQSCIFYPSLKDTDPSEILQKFCFRIFADICDIMICLECVVFLKSP